MAQSQAPTSERKTEEKQAPRETHRQREQGLRTRALNASSYNEARELLLQRLESSRARFQRKWDYLLKLECHEKSDYEKKQLRWLSAERNNFQTECDFYKDLALAVSLKNREWVMAGTDGNKDNNFPQRPLPKITYMFFPHFKRLHSFMPDPRALPKMSDSSQFRKYTNQLREAILKVQDPEQPNIAAAVRAFDCISECLESSGDDGVSYIWDLSGAIPLSSYRAVCTKGMLSILAHKYLYQGRSKQEAVQLARQARDKLYRRMHAMITQSVRDKKPCTHVYILHVASACLDVFGGQRGRSTVCNNVYNDLCRFLDKLVGSQTLQYTHDLVQAIDEAEHETSSTVSHTSGARDIEASDTKEEELEMLPAHEREYAKWLLGWIWLGPKWDVRSKDPRMSVKKIDYFKLLQTKAREVVQVLGEPLVETYQQLEIKNSPIIQIKLMKQYKYPNNKVDSNRELLGFMWEEWFEKEGMDVTDKLVQMAKKYCEWGFDSTIIDDDDDDNDEDLSAEATEAKVLEYLQDLSSVTNTMFIRYLPAEMLVLDMINQVAAKVQRSFQKSMDALFAKNRKKLQYAWNAPAAGAARNSIYDVRDEIGVKHGDLKTKARQLVKLQRDYKDAPEPRAASILDIVRCAMVCEDDIELYSLFKMIMAQYSGRVLRINNEFSNEKGGQYGYRVVFINVIEIYKVPGKDTEMPIICEIQLLLNLYYQVRKAMYLPLCLVKAESAQRLALDACRVGRFDL